VVAEVDFTITEKTNESYNPDASVVRSEQVQEEQRVGVAGAIGVPGALSNQPPGGGIAPEVAVDAEGQANNTVTPGSTSKNSTRNFEVDRTISHTRVAPGSVRKLSVAVLVDERRTINEDGTVTSTPLSEGEMTRINALIMDAIGFNKARGDSLNIVNAPFVVPASAEPLPEPAIWEQPWVWTLAKQVLGGLLVLFLVFGVIRPAFKDLNKVPVDPNAANANGENGGMTPEQALAMGNQAPGAKGIEEIATGSKTVEATIDNVRSLVQQDPALVAQVVKNWTES
jgi:flagellar M-ring protein FliF